MPRARAADPRKRCTGWRASSPFRAAPRPENDLALLPIGQLEWHLDRGAGIQCRRPPCRKAASDVIAAGLLQRSVATNEFSPVAADAPRRIVHIEKSNPFAELLVVWIAREERAAVRVDLA